LHVKGFTARANSGVTPAKRGTFAGVTEKIPYLKDLGVTIVELLPVQQFDPQEKKYWGYMTLHFFSPHQQYAHGEAFEEFRAMVQAFHAAGIEVWLDVVYNHTAEGDQNGPNYSYRGIDNDSYYLLTHDLRHYINDTRLRQHCAYRAPCGARAGARKPPLLGANDGRGRLPLRPGIDLFTRGRRNDGPHEASLVGEIGLLARLLPCASGGRGMGLLQLSTGPRLSGMAWMHGTASFRDDCALVRARRTGQDRRAHAAALRSSNDLFSDDLQDTRRPHQSVNFLTAHDGFCLYDLVAYDRSTTRPTATTTRTARTTI
jgi:glycogen operon protein